MLDLVPPELSSYHVITAVFFMEIIDELEPDPRGLYTGAIGYLGDNGESQFNIAIRTAVAEGDEISFHVGAGIVADSVPAKEYDETLHKAAGLLQALRRG